MLAAVEETKALGRPRPELRTATVVVSLTGASYRLAHDAAHQLAQLWNTAVDWVHAQWREDRSPDKKAIRKHLTSLPRTERPFHAHSTEAVAYDLFEAIETFRTNRANGMDVRPPWRKKNYRPISFTRGYGWRVTPGGALALSLGRGRPRILLPLPEVKDSGSGEIVGVELWREIQLCWDRGSRVFELHIAYFSDRGALKGDRLAAIDQGVINPMAIATRDEHGDFDVLVITGREARSIRRGRAKNNGQYQRRISRAKNGSKHHRRLVISKRLAQGTATRQLRDLDHNVARKAARFLEDHHVGRVVAGDLDGIEKDTKTTKRLGRRQRQEISTWSRARQERYLREATLVELEHVDERDTTKTCPKCGARNRPKGRWYRCKEPGCGLECHRDAVGAVNIWTKAGYGEISPIGDASVRVTYLRAVPRWSTEQRRRHSARSRATNQAAGISGGREARSRDGDSSSLAAEVSSGVSADPLVVAA